MNSIPDFQKLLSSGFHQAELGVQCEARLEFDEAKAHFLTALEFVDEALLLDESNAHA